MKPWFALIALLLACTTPSVQTSRVDPDADDGLGVGGIDSQELRTICQRMARELLDCSELFAGGVPRVVMQPPENRTAHFLDPEVFLNIRTYLVEFAGSRIRFLAREDLDTVLQERNAKRDGTLGYTQLGTLSGADYLLNGTITGISKQGVAGRSDYYSCRFRLVNMESGELLWERMYEFKKAGSTSAVYR